MDEDIITRIYCDADDFCKALERYCKTHMLPRGKARKWFPASQLSLSEAMAIILLFHLPGYRCFKWYYHRHACAQMYDYFPTPVSCSRFVELMNLAPLTLLLYTVNYLATDNSGSFRAYSRICS